MRVIILILLFGILAVGCGNPREQADTERIDRDQITEKTQSGRDFRTYLFKSGMVTYELKGLPEGNEVLYWDDWGMNIARYMETWSPYTPGEKDTTIIIMDHDNTYTIDTKKKSGVMSPMRPKEVIDFSVGDTEVVEKEMSKRGIAGGYEVLPDEDFMGVPCQVAKIEVMGNTSKQWLHKGIMLKMETVSKKSGKRYSSQKAVEFKPDVTVDPSVFQIPEDIKIKTLAEVQAQARQAMKNSRNTEKEGE